MNAKISIVIPVYGTEQYLERCINSVIKQNYRNLEIIVVNDCSPGNAEEIINKYSKLDKRILYLKHEENRGLFQARITGAKKASGDYIAFLDSDDYINFDFYYGLLKKAEEERADIVIGETVIENENGEHYVNHFHECSLNIVKLEDEAVRKTFFSYQGRCYGWHTVWNKLYKIELWRKAQVYFEKVSGHIIMTEDIAFSSVLFYFAQKVVKVNTSAYFYCVNAGASTNSKNMTITKFKKNMSDIIAVFDFVQDFLKEQDADNALMEDYLSFRKFYAKLWLGLVEGDFVGKYKKEALQYIEKLYPHLKTTMHKEDYFYDSARTKWNDGIEVAKKLISDSNIEYVSFDIFDTLITRPLYTPQHVFELMDIEFKKLLHTNVSFPKIRLDGENSARMRMGQLRPEYQDVTIDEIYDEIENRYQMDHKHITVLKNLEINLEVELSQCRSTIRELYELAKNLNKKIIIVSDMYLTKETIEQILKKNGYSAYEKLYLSSDIRLTKNTGDLFKYVLNDLAIAGEKILHFGDTWTNDFINPERLGIKTYFIPKTIEVFENIIQGQNTNRCSDIGNWAAGGVVKHDLYKKSIGYGAMMALVANKYFDNPYRTFNEKSDFNADPYFVGYYLVGMHLFGFCKWLLDQAKALGFKTLYFMSRDGYLPMLVYEKLAVNDKDAPEAKYLYSSRKAVMPYIMNTAFDLYDYPTVITNQSARSMKQRLKFCMRDVSEREYAEVLEHNHIDVDSRFNSKCEYDEFIKVFIAEFYSKDVHLQNKRRCAEYYKQIDVQSATVDMGYSGRIQGAISEAVGHGVDVFFVHSDENQHVKESIRHNFKIYSFYEYTPCVSGVIREHILSSSEPSCVGFLETKGKIEPLFEETQKEIQDKKVIQQIQRGTLDFVNDFIGIFGKYIEQIPIKSQEISLPYEGFIRFANNTDIQIFSGSFFEDEVWGGANRINIADFIKNQTADYNLNNCFPNAVSSVSSEINENVQLKKVKEKLRKYPILYKLAKKIYYL